VFSEVIKGIFCETGDAFFDDRSYQAAIMPVGILFPVMSDHIDSATDNRPSPTAGAIKWQ